MSDPMDAGNFTVAPSPELEPWAKEALGEQTQAQASEQQQLDPASSEVLLFQVPALAWSDEEGLAELLIKHPDLHEQIVATAAAFHGNTTIYEAIEIARRETERSKAAAEPKQETTPPQVVEAQAEERRPTGGDAQIEEQPAQEAEPGWVVRARAYNSNHEDEVNLFNIATGYAARDANGRPDPAAIARWQADNGLEPDGRIGQSTADLAWQLMPVEAPKQEAPTTDELPPPL